MIDWHAFHFLRPAWLAALLPLLPWLWLFCRRGRGSAAWRRVCDAHLLRQLLVSNGGGARRVPALLAAAAWTATCLALAGPTWERLPQPAVGLAEQRALVLCLAPSMASRDVAPSRAARARFALRDALRALPGADVGLVIYAEEAYAVTPLTDDPDVIEAMLPVLEPSIMPGRGSRLDRAIDEARSLLEGAGAHAGRIVVVTDSSGQAPAAARDAAERAAEAGFPVGVLAVGDADHAGLEALARAGRGRFAPVGVDARALASVVGATDTALPGLDGAPRSDVRVDSWRDAGRLLLWIPLLLAPLGFRRGWAGALAVAGLLLVQPAPARAGVVADLFARRDQQGARAFAAGRNADAAALFEDPAWRAAALYRQGDYAGSVEALAGRDDTESVYNRGNALARAGRLREALAAYEEVLARSPDHADARHNRDLVKKLLDRSAEPQPQPTSGNPSQEESEEPPQETSRAQPQPTSGNPSQEESEEQPQQTSEPQPGQTSQQPQAQRQEPPSQPQKTQPPSQEQASPPQEQPSTSQPQQSQEPESPQQQPQRASSRPRPAEGPQPSGREGSPDGPRDADGSAGDASPRPLDASPRPLDASPRPRDAGEATPAAAAAASRHPLSESEQSTEQWLRRVPDDPAGLLREKLRRSYAEKRTGVRLGGAR